jgi:hypothetical protein
LSPTESKGKAEEEMPGKFSRHSTVIIVAASLFHLIASPQNASSPGKGRNTIWRAEL